MEAGEEQKDVVEKPTALEATETVKDKKAEISKEQDNMVEKQEIMQLATIEAAQQILTTETKAEESDTPVEENEEAMLPEDGILLMYVEKLSGKNSKNMDNTNNRST